MTQHIVPDNAQGIALFPEYATLYDLVTREVERLSTSSLNGVTPAEEPDKLVMTLEATFRHMYFEELTHLYNIQRLKRAQGLPTVVEIPRVGYWTLDDWDRSEP